MNMRCGWMFVMLLPALAFGQQRPVFDTVSVKVSDGTGRQDFIPNNQGFEARNVSVGYCIEMAWR